MDLAFGWLSECLLGYPVGASAEERQSYRIAPIEKRVTSKCKFFCQSKCLPLLLGGNW